MNSKQVGKVTTPPPEVIALSSDDEHQALRRVRHDVRPTQGVIQPENYEPFSLQPGDPIPTRVEDALAYLDQVRCNEEDPVSYMNFLDIMKDFKNNTIDTPGVIRRVACLFRTRPELITGFNAFLPSGYEIQYNAQTKMIHVNEPDGSHVEIANPAPPGTGPPHQPPVVQPETQTSSNIAAMNIPALAASLASMSANLSPIAPNLNSIAASIHPSVLPQRQQPEDFLSAAAAAAVAALGLQTSDISTLLNIAKTLPAEIPQLSTSTFVPPQPRPAQTPAPAIATGSSTPFVVPPPPVTQQYYQQQHHHHQQQQLPQQHSQAQLPQQQQQQHHHQSQQQHHHQQQLQQQTQPHYQQQQQQQQPQHVQQQQPQQQQSQQPQQQGQENVFGQINYEALRAQCPQMTVRELSRSYGSRIAAQARSAAAAERTAIQEALGVGKIKYVGDHEHRGNRENDDDDGSLLEGVEVYSDGSELEEEIPQQLTLRKATKRKASRKQKKKPAKMRREESPEEMGHTGDEDSDLETWPIIDERDGPFPSINDIAAANKTVVETSDGKKMSALEVLSELREDNIFFPHSTAERQSLLAVVSQFLAKVKTRFMYRKGLFSAFMKHLASIMKKQKRTLKKARDQNNDPKYSVSDDALDLLKKMFRRDPDLYYELRQFIPGLPNEPLQDHAPVNVYEDDYDQSPDESMDPDDIRNYEFNLLPTREELTKPRSPPPAEEDILELRRWKKNVKPKRRIRSIHSFVDIEVFDIARRLLTYNERSDFLRTLSLFIARVLDRNDLMAALNVIFGDSFTLVRPYFEEALENPILIEAKTDGSDIIPGLPPNLQIEFVSGDFEDSMAVDPKQGENGAPIAEEAQRVRSQLARRINYATCAQLGVSYRKLPDWFESPVARGRTELCKEVINDTYVSFPTWQTDDTTHVTQKKSSYEDFMHRLEDERYELDIVLAINKHAVNAMEVLTVEMSKGQHIKVQDVFGDFDDPPMRRIYRGIRRIYGESTDQVMEALKKTPEVAVPRVLMRLKQKREEWLTAQKSMNDTWRDAMQKYYYRSLDYALANTKLADQHRAKGRHYIQQIEENFDARQGLDPYEIKTESGPHVVLGYHPDESVFHDVGELILHYVVKNYPSEDIKRMETFLRIILPEWFGFPQRYGVIGVRDIKEEKSRKSKKRARASPLPSPQQDDEDDDEEVEDEESDENMDEDLESDDNEDPDSDQEVLPTTSTIKFKRKRQRIDDSHVEDEELSDDSSSDVQVLDDIESKYRKKEAHKSFPPNAKIAIVSGQEFLLDDNGLVVTEKKVNEEDIIELSDDDNDDEESDSELEDEDNDSEEEDGEHGYRRIHAMNPKLTHLRANEDPEVFVIQSTRKRSVKYRGVEQVHFDRHDGDETDSNEDDDSDHAMLDDFIERDDENDRETTVKASTFMMANPFRLPMPKKMSEMTLLDVENYPKLYRAKNVETRTAIAERTSTYRMLYTSNAGYAFIRLHHQIWCRLSEYKKRCAEVLETQLRSDAVHAHRHQELASSDICGSDSYYFSCCDRSLFSDLLKDPRYFYEASLQELRNLVNGVLEQTTIEERLRVLMPSYFHMLCTFDRFVANAAKYMYSMLEEEIDFDTVELYMQHRLPKPQFINQYDQLRTRSELAYCLESEQRLCYENCYKILFLHAPGDIRCLVEMVDTEIPKRLFHTIKKARQDHYRAIDEVRLTNSERLGFMPLFYEDYANSIHYRPRFLGRNVRRAHTNDRFFFEKYAKILTPPYQQNAQKNFNVCYKRVIRNTPERLHALTVNYTSRKKRFENNVLPDLTNLRRDEQPFDWITPGTQKFVISNPLLPYIQRFICVSMDEFNEGTQT